MRVISTENEGLSSARNTGWHAATGEFVAYIDDDAYPDPHWLKYIAYAFLTSTHEAIGGPNIAPPGDGLIADCVANAPGGPVHVLLTDTVAEHIPGCNMAFRRSALAAIGGFDVRFRAAGDDVDVCWRLMENGGTIGFHAGAMDWHHRRNCLPAYWRQQKGYGKAEALLEDKWPERYNAVGHVVWEGRMYGKGCTKALPLGRWHVYQGTWGTASYQSLYEREPTTLESLPLMPEWYLVILGLALLAALGAAWPALLMISLPLLLIAVAAPIGQALNAADRAHFATPSSGALEAFSKRALTCLLHLIQPAARLTGRLQHGLLPWRRRGEAPKRAPWPRHVKLWSERWRGADEWLRSVQSAMQLRGAIVICAGDFDGWDLHVRGGLFGAARGLLTIEEHGAGKQLLKFGIRPWAPVPLISMGAGLWTLTLVAALSQAWIACGVLATVCVLLGGAFARDCAAAAGTWLAAIDEIRAADPRTRA